MVGEALRLEVEAGQGAAGHGADLGAQPQPVAQLVLQRGAHRRRVAVAHLDADLHLVQLLAPVHVDGKLADLGEAAHDVLDGAREDVDAAHDHHVVDPPDHPAGEAQEAAPALAGLGGDPHPVAAAVAQERHPRPPQVGQHQLALPRRRPRLGVDHLADELALVHVQARLRLALEPPGPHLRRPGVVVTARPPGRLDPRLRRRHARPRLAGVDRDVDAGVDQVDPLLLRHLRQVQRIGRRADQHRDVVLEDRLRPLIRRHAAPRHRQRPAALRPLVGAPEADERAEGEGEEDPVARRDPGGPVDRRPAARPPGPALIGVQPLQRLARRPRGLVDARVGLARVGEVRAVGRVLRLVPRQLRLGGERQPPEVLEAPHVRRRLQPHPPQPPPVERVVAQQRPQHQLQLLQLDLRQRLAAQRLYERIQVGRVHLHS